MMRKLIWQDLLAAREKLISEIDAAHASPRHEFTDKDREEWEEIAAALDYTPTPQEGTP